MRTSLSANFKFEIVLHYLVTGNREATNNDIPGYSIRRNHQALQLLGSLLSWELQILMVQWAVELVL
jgi:hypothetical protein